MLSDPPDGYVPASEARKRLGISDRTLRRRVQAGTIEGEYIPRPQGSVLYVKLPDAAAPQTAPDAAQASQEPPPATVDAASHAAVVTALLERLDGKDAALLAATERAVRAEGDRDAARQTAEAAQQLTHEIARQRDDLADRLARAEQERDAARRASWWARLLGRG